MVSKKNWLGILAAMALVLGMMVIGCDDGAKSDTSGGSNWNGPGGGEDPRDEEELGDSNPGGNDTGGSDNDPNRVSTPITNISAGNVLYGTEVLLGTTTVGAIIYYTTDGSEPTIFSRVFSSSEPIILKDTTVPITIKAIAMAAGMNTSDVMTVVYTLRLYNVGDIGPAGGKIFYVNETGFTMTDTGETCYHLEVAPSSITDPQSKVWSYNYTNAYIHVNTGTAIGTGRKNLALILAVDDINQNAAKYCKDYSLGGKTDWFFPSVDELQVLYDNRSFVADMSGEYYWWSSSEYEYTSSSYPYMFARYLNSTSGNFGYAQKVQPYYVVVIRAF